MTDMPQKDNMTSDMEDKLKADKSGELKKQLSNRLTLQIEKVDAELKSGVSPDEFKRLNTIKVGLQSSLVVLERIWLFYHSN
ncbi:MAG: hypothetical protein ACNYNY_00140 [Candidatus Oxydemutatoraceae bacterium WSBS_2016_MAG_OTU14]